MISVEFMEHFLDVLHEDLNKVDRKNIQPASPIENEDELSDEQLANEQWNRYKERNDSIMTKLFYGQYRSKLVCQKCSKISITFDPFLILPIPLTKNKLIFNLYLFPLDIEQPPKRMSIKLPQGSKFLSLLEIVSARTDLDRFDLIPCQISQNGELDKEFRFTSEVPDQLAKSKKLYIYQKPEEKTLNKFIIHQTIPDCNVQCANGFNLNGRCEFCNRPLNKAGLNPQNCLKCNKVTYCNEKCLQDDNELHIPKCRNEPILVGWPSIFFCDLSTVIYDEFMTKLERAALRSVEVIEKEIEEEELKAEKNDVHIGQEIKEGQLDLDSNEIASDANEKQAAVEEEMEVCPDTNSSGKEEEKSSDSLLANTSLNEDSLNKENEEDKKEANDSEEIKDDNYRFRLNGKTDDINLVKKPIYKPKDDSDIEQIKFRKSLEKYYFLYVDWKDRYTKINDEDSKLDVDTEIENEIENKISNKTTYALSIQSRNLNLVATGSSNFNLDQERTDCTLEDLMVKFTEPETLSTQEAWVCPNCKEPRTASKELTIWRPPQNLIIQLKRFSYSAYSREKIDKFVNYPIKGLDITKYCADKSFLDQTKPIYDLYAVIDHFGGLYGGHYTANANSTVNNNQELGEVLLFLFKLFKISY